MLGPVKWLMLPGAALFAAALVFVANWLALIPWRRARNAHWTERARVYHPVRVAAQGCLWTLPITLGIASFLLGPERAPHFALVGLAAALGALVGTLPMEREVFPRIDLGRLFRLAAAGWCLRCLFWFVLLGGIALMPDSLNWQCLAIGALVLGLAILRARNGGMWLWKPFGLVAAPPAALRETVDTMAKRMNIEVRNVHFLRLPLAQAFALPGQKSLIFTERIVELLPADELASVCAHELGHLSERRREYLQRYFGWAAFLPWLFLRPAVGTLGSGGFLLLALLAVLVPYLSRRVSVALEVRADRIAQANETDPGAYARALARLYEDGLIPAVLAQNRATHPHLYDRLVAAGVSPDYPRPKPARSMAWHGRLVTIGFAGAVAILVLRLVERS
jgi:Zn-dependent protease with chaperone function